MAGRRSRNQIDRDVFQEGDQFGHALSVAQIEILNAARNVVSMGLKSPRIVVDRQRNAVAGPFKAETETP